MKEKIAPLDGLVTPTVVDGVPLLLASKTGPVTGGICFRVGYADEALPVAGITHLVEHLALHGSDLADQHSNGHTTEQWTYFHATGTSEEVVTFLNDVCAGLRNLPTGRIDTEKSILRTEASRGGRGGIHSAMRTWRYGARGPGLIGQDEEGLFRIGAAEVEEWARTWFTSGNAVAFLTLDEVPETLSLELPPGGRRPVALPPETLPSKPAWFCGGFDGIVLDAMVRRSMAAHVFSGVATRVLMRELRRDQGLSYDAGCSYDRIDAAHARLTIYADALEEKSGVVVSVVAEILAGMRAGQIDQADVDAIRKQLRAETDIPDLGAAMLASTAIGLLLDADVFDPRDSSELERVTVEDVAAVARELWSDALISIPGGHGFGGASRAPHLSESAVEGTVFASLVRDGHELIIGADGVSRSMPGSVVTVRFDALAAMVAVPDGARRLIAEDALAVVVEPTLWKGLSTEIVKRDIDSRVPAGLVLPYPARAAEVVPEPPKRPARQDADPSRAASGWTGFGPWAAWTALIVFIAAFIGTLPALIGAYELMVGDPAGEDLAITVVWIGITILLWILGAGLGAGVRRRIKLGE
ncbi:insulinase family protein [Nocardioides sp. CCNWLW239]|uniref:insulinase family protein n=1 Tax=Nocardioides sp. CCNWLW239 TaxID=3128902 RepID=UPI00301AF112